MPDSAQRTDDPATDPPAPREGDGGGLAAALARRTRLTPAGAAVMLLAAATGAAAYRSGNNFVFALFSLLLAALLLSRALPWLSTRRLVVCRTAPEEIYASQPATISLAAENRASWIPALGVTVRDLVDVKLFRDGPAPYFLRLPPRARAEAFYAIRFRRRGRYRGEAFEIECAFPFGLFAKTFRGRHPATFIVLPKPRPLARHILPTEEGIPLGGPDPARRTGEDSEFRALRPYQPGDPLKRIHWKTSARARQLFVRVLETRERRRATVLLDTLLEPDADPRRLRSNVGLERGVRVAASLAAWFERSGFSYRFGTACPDTTLTEFGRGPRHLRRILELLAVVEPSTDSGPERLARDALHKAGGDHPMIVLLLDARHAETLRAFTRTPRAAGLQAYDASKPGLPRLL